MMTLALDQFDVLIKMMTDMMIVSATFAGSHCLKVFMDLVFVFVFEKSKGGGGFYFSSRHNDPPPKF